MPKKDLSIARHFADLPDPRVDRTKKHAVGDILVIALCAGVAVADSWEVSSASTCARSDGSPAHADAT